MSSSFRPHAPSQTGAKGGCNPKNGLQRCSCVYGAAITAHACKSQPQNRSAAQGHSRFLEHSSISSIFCVGVHQFGTASSEFAFTQPHIVCQCIRTGILAEPYCKARHSRSVLASSVIAARRSKNVLNTLKCHPCDGAMLYNWCLYAKICHPCDGATLYLVPHRGIPVVWARGSCKQGAFPIKHLALPTKYPENDDL